MDGESGCAVKRLRTAAAALVAAAAAAVAAPAAAASPSVPLPAVSCGDLCVRFAPDSAVAAGTADASGPLNKVLAATPPGWTVQLPAGTLRLAAPVKIPAGVTVAGAGMDATRLLLDRRAWAKFHYGFMVAPASPAATGVTVSDVTVDGNRVAVDEVGAAAPAGANQGGGVKAGSGWTVRRVRLSNVNYFKLWAKDVSQVTFEHNRFEDVGAGQSGGNDNVGGGGVDGLRVAGNVFTQRSAGNAVDLVRSVRVTVEDNEMAGTAAAPHNVYLEGVTDARVAGNVLRHSSISVQSDAGYASAVKVTNPRRVQVVGNTITAPAAQGISVRYDAGGARPTAPGGDNTVAGNTVVRAGVAAVVVFAADTALVEQPDRVVGNTVTDAFTRKVSSWNCGYGTTRAAGVVVGAGRQVVVEGNKVTRTGPVSSMTVGVSVGVVSARNVAVTVAAPTVPNRAVGVPLGM